MQQNVKVDAVIEKVKNEMIRLAYSNSTIEVHELVWENSKIMRTGEGPRTLQQK